MLFGPYLLITCVMSGFVYPIVAWMVCRVLLLCVFVAQQGFRVAQVWGNGIFCIGNSLTSARNRADSMLSCCLRRLGSD